VEVIGGRWQGSALRRRRRRSRGGDSLLFCTVLFLCPKHMPVLLYFASTTQLFIHLPKFS